MFTASGSASVLCPNIGEGGSRGGRRAQRSTLFKLMPAAECAKRTALEGRTNISGFSGAESSAVGQEHVEAQAV